MHPKGHYTNVRALLVRGDGGSLEGVEGEFQNGVFTCGPFPWHRRPRKGDRYIITGICRGLTYAFQKLECTHGARVSHFRMSGA